MTADETRAVSQQVLGKNELDHSNKEDVLTEEFYRIAKSFIKDDSEDGKFETGVCHTYTQDCMFDRKYLELHQWALERAAAKLRREGFSSHFYHNRAIKTMGIKISWRR